MKTIHKLLLLTAACSTSLSLHAAPAAKPPANFSVVPQKVAEALKGKTGPYTKDFMDGANSALQREPRPIVRVHLEGTLPTAPGWHESLDSSRDWVRMMQLAMAYRTTGKQVFLAAEERYLTAWLDIYKISFNPIDESPMDKMIIAYDLTRADLPQALRSKMEDFERQMASGYIARIQAEKTEDIYNWQSHRIKLALLCAYGIGDEQLEHTALALYRHHLQGNLLPGNVVIDFPRRDALHYTVYDLEPLTMAALAANLHGTPVFAETNAVGSSVCGAVDWLLPYALGQKTHIEFEHSSVSFDQARAKAGMQDFIGAWKPVQSLLLYAEALSLDDAYAALYTEIQARTGCHTHDWLLVLHQAGL